MTLTEQAAQDFIEGDGELKLTIQEIAEKYFPLPVTDNTIKRSYKLTERLTRHFDQARDPADPTKPLYQFGNLNGVYQLATNATESIDQMMPGLNAARSKMNHQFTHAAVAVALYPVNRKELVKTTKAVADAAIALVGELSQQALASVNFYEQVPAKSKKLSAGDKSDEQIKD